MAFDFNFNNFGGNVKIQIDEDNQAMCPQCKCKFKQLIQHLKKNSDCRTLIENFESFRNEYQLFTNRRKQSIHRKRKLEADAAGLRKDVAKKVQMHRKAKLDNNAVELHNIEAKQKRFQRSKKIDNNDEEVHTLEATKKRYQRGKKLDDNAEELHKNEAAKKRYQRGKKLENNAEDLHNYEATKERYQRGKKLDENAEVLHKAEADYKRSQKNNKLKKVTAKDRLSNFKRAVLFGPIFVCSCCHVKHFESWVTKVEETMKAKLFGKYPDCYTECVREFVKVRINAETNYYFCKTCMTYMNSGRIPPMSVCNKLDVINSNDSELQLSELENSLIALRIMFQKIYYLPKSRWTGLKDRVINIPVEKANVINTIKQLPRLPAEAGLVEVKLKRKIEYKNTHKREYVDPNKIFKALNYLKACGHPGYKDFNTREEYIDRCRLEDNEGYERIFRPDHEVDEVFESLDPLNIDELQLAVNDEVDDQEAEILNDEVYYKENDPVAKFQFDYDRSTCLTEKYPEVAINEVPNCQELCFAPGEGKYPSDILMDKSWDINAFPLLHPNGKYGLHDKREITVKLTDQSYLKQRFRNKDSRFIDNKAYLYSAVAYVERKQLQNNINLSYTKGKKSIAADGAIQYELDDAFQVFENIKNTPRYWRKAKYEMLAKLDNLGPFQIFFTLSSADMRWEENFTSILRERNIQVQYDLETLETEIELKDTVTNEIITKSLADFLKDDVDESLHELIRTNVLTAVLNFNQRFTAFKREIIFGANNPMEIKFFSSKLEFAMRGAGHVHGVLWCDLDKLDNEDEIDEETENIKYRFPGIKKIFCKIRRNEYISDDEANVLARFADTFTTCSLNADEVGENVAKIAAKVNCHHHTFTCRKYCIKCRFNFPKYPIWKTIISRPRSEEIEDNVSKFKSTLDKVKTLLECPEVIAEIMSKYQKDKETKEEYDVNRKKRILELLEIANVTEQEYLDALKYSKAGYNVVLKRDLDEIFINNYNPEWLEAWDGNIDFSICLDYFAVLTYITEYFCKTDSTMQELLKEAAKNIDSNKSQRERKILLSNTFLTHRQMGEAEAIYKIFPNLKMKDSNVTCVFLQTGKREERSKFLTAMGENSNWHDKVGIQVKGKEGLVVEKPDILDKYCRKHKSVGMISPSQFAKIYESTSKVPKKYCIDEEDDQDMDDADLEMETDKEYAGNQIHNKWHFVMTYKEEYAKPLPKYFKLDPVYPGEPAYMRRRDFPACLRFHKVKEHTDPQKYFKSQIMLYTYFQNEEELHFDDPKWVDDKFNESMNGVKRNIQIVKEQVMEHLESVEEARYFVDELHKNQIDEAGGEFDAQNAQDDMECLEEDITEHPEFSHLNPDELESFEANCSKVQPMRVIETGSVDELVARSRSHDKYQRKVVEMGIRYARSIVKARSGNNRFPEPVQLMVHGGAGSGKSTVIDALAKWIQHVIVQSGDGPQFPYTVKGAPTGAAASIIEGQTMHSLFNFSFGNEFFSLSDKIRDEKRLLYQNLNIIILDEISLVKSDMQFQLDLRLKEVKMDDRIFGGVSVFVFGDMMQMKPVMGSYIFQKPNSKEYELAYLQGKHWQSFQIINLEENHRQGNDGEYADVLNRIRIGEQTEADIDLLRTRVRQPTDSDILEAKDALYISATNKEVKKINDERMAKINAAEFLAEAVHIHQTMKNYKPRIDKATGRIAKTSFVDKLKLRIGAKVMLIHNIDTVDGLTNGCLGILVDVLKTNAGKLDKLIIEFTNPKHGVLKRMSNPTLHKKYPNGTPIETVMFSYTLSKKAGGVGNSAKLVQFPICVAFATTCHKFQGQTVPRHLKLIIDLRHIWGPAMAYVMLSRVMQLSQLFIIGDVNGKKIYPDAAALIELKRMNEASINNNPSNWNNDKIKSLKISALNCRSLRSKINDIREDFELRQSDMICLSETWLNEGDELLDLQMDGYFLHVNSSGCGKGLATYFKICMFSHEIDVKKEEIQISKFTSKLLDVVSIYRSKECQLKFEDIFQNIVSKEKTTLILGDMNICYKKQRNDKNIQYLETQNFKQLVKGATHFLGGQIDHAYLADPEARFDADIQQYAPYYTARDHDGLLITLTYK